MCEKIIKIDNQNNNIRTERKLTHLEMRPLIKGVGGWKEVRNTENDREKLEETARSCVRWGTRCEQMLCLSVCSRAREKAPNSTYFPCTLTRLR